MRPPKRREGESGQALVELAVSMIGLMCVFIGVLLMATLGLGNIQNLLTAKTLADQGAKQGATSSDVGSSVLRWNLGADNLLMTADDTPVTGGEGDSAVYTNELSLYSADSEIGSDLSISSFDLASSLSSCSYIDQSNNFAANGALGSGSLYLSAADLASGQSYEGDPLGKKNMTYVKELFNKLIAGGSFRLSDTVYMPKISD